MSDEPTFDVRTKLGQHDEAIRTIKGELRDVWGNIKLMQGAESEAAIERALQGQSLKGVVDSQKEMAAAFAGLKDNLQAAAEIGAVFKKFQKWTVGLVMALGCLLVLTFAGTVSNNANVKAISSIIQAGEKK